VHGERLDADATVDRQVAIGTAVDDEDGTGRDGRQRSSAVISPATTAIAATRSASAQATSYAISPPFEMPVA